MIFVNLSKDEHALQMIINYFEVDTADANCILADMKSYVQNIEVGFAESTIEEIGEPLFADPSSIYSPLPEFYAQRNALAA